MVEISSDVTENLHRRSIWMMPLLLAAMMFVAVAPTLPFLEFSSGSENLNVQTALEMRRGGPWLIPTLKGYPRTTKPPLTAWITAAFVRPETVAALSDPNPIQRDLAYARLAWEVRWPALMFTCIMLLAIFDLGTTLVDRRTGLLAMVVAATNLLTLRYGRSATTDVQLALWVTIANAMLARAVFKGQHWRGYVGGGIAVGLALMSKGPVALIQTLLPFVVVVCIRGLRQRAATVSERSRGAEHSLTVAAPCSRSEDRNGGPDKQSTAQARFLNRIRLAWAPIIAGTIAMMLIGLPWYVHVLLATPDIQQAWIKEVTREGATDLKPDAWYAYFLMLLLMFPWLIFFSIGIILCVRDRAVPNYGPLIALVLVIVPIVIMSFFKDKPDRYLLPMVGSSAIVTAFGLRQQLAPSAQRNQADHALTNAQWIVVGLMVIGIPIVGASGFKDVRDIHGEPWYTVTEALIGFGLLACAAFVGALITWRQHAPVIGATTATMLVAGILIVFGYRDSFSGRSEMKPIADTIHDRFPGAIVAYLKPVPSKAQPVDLAIYLNRTLVEVNDLSELPTDREPTVAMAYQRPGEPVPVWPIGWTPYQVVSWEHGKRTWHMAVRELQSTNNPNSAVRQSIP